MPRLGPGATLTMADGKTVAGELIGLDLNAVWLVEGLNVRQRKLDGAQRPQRRPRPGGADGMTATRLE